VASNEIPDRDECRRLRRGTGFRSPIVREQFRLFQECQRGRYRGLGRILVGWPGPRLGDSLPPTPSLRRTGGVSPESRIPKLRDRDWGWSDAGTSSRRLARCQHPGRMLREGVRNEPEASKSGITDDLAKAPPFPETRERWGTRHQDPEQDQKREQECAPPQCALSGELYQRQAMNSLFVANHLALRLWIDEVRESLLEEKIPTLNRVGLD